jgi:signal peptidase II
MKKAFIVIFLVLLADQALKLWVKTSMFLGQEYHITDWFIIHFTENNGMAFGMELGKEYGKLLLSVFRLGAIGAIFYYLFKIIKEKAPNGLIICISLILAGAIGNILDSVFYGAVFSSSYHQVAEFMPEAGGYSNVLYGKVVDMLYFPLISGYFPDWFPIWGGEFFMFFRPVFNVADTSISFGVGFIILFQKKYFAESKKDDTNSEKEEQQEEKEVEFTTPE